MADSSQGAFIEGGRRPPFFRYAWRLYRSHDGFRGLIDFAIIGTVVVMFVQPPSFEWARNLTKMLWSGVESTFVSPKTAGVPGTSTPPAPPTAKPAGETSKESASAPAATPSAPAAAPKEQTPPTPVIAAPAAPKPAEEQQQAAAPDQSKAAPAQPPAVASEQVQKPSTTAAAVAVPMPLVQEVRSPRVTTLLLVGIDDQAFRSSKPEDRERLSQALTKHRAMRFDEILDHLSSASSADPNVLFMRALGVMASVDSNRLRTAHDFLRVAVAGGHRQAAVVLGALLVSGTMGVDKNLDEGKRLIEGVAARGDRMAQRVAGIAHNNGEFGALDPAKGAAFLTTAANAGDPPAMLYFANLLANGAAVEKNEALAEDYLRRAATAGLTAAQEALGTWIMDRYKVGQTSDPSEGIRWLTQAYEVGHSITALFRLAVFYADDGRGSWRDRQKSFALLGLCERFASSQCQFAYANHLRNGFGTPTDYLNAYARFEVARMLGSSNASQRLERLQPLITAEEKTAALERAKSLRHDLRPVPAKWSLQYSDIRPSASPWQKPAEASAK
jgi:TPR repeat protein